MSLEADGIHPRIHDFDRIRMALGAGGDWTPSRLHGVLSALLIKEKDQKALFAKRFDAFFNPRPIRCTGPCCGLSGRDENSAR